MRMTLLSLFLLFCLPFSLAAATNTNQSNWDSLVWDAGCWDFSVASVASVPTMRIGAMVIFALLLAGVAVISWRRQDLVAKDSKPTVS